MTDKKKILDDIAAAGSLGDLEKLRVALLGKSGALTAELKALGALPADGRKAKGAELNAVKGAAEAAIAKRRDELEAAEAEASLVWRDVTLSRLDPPAGRIHPLSQVKDELVQIFGAMGFKYADGPDVEDDFHNFGALNFQPNHPARDTQDTFFVDGGNLMRTQTSDVQIRAMEKYGAPIKIITMGRTYRRDWDATHFPMFHQIEGLWIDKGITMAHLKSVLTNFLKAFFEVDDAPLQFRPHYFPFTEPSAEIDVRCTFENGELKIGKDGKRWLEILGSGMVHPQVLRNVGIDPEEYQGFAFGTGIERIAMLKYGIDDGRRFFESDARWLRHYGFAPDDVPTIATGLSER
jgi:phenylalanyl-tRNA synthetase alpha chain